MKSISPFIFFNNNSDQRIAIIKQKQITQGQSKFVERKKIDNEFVGRTIDRSTALAFAGMALVKKKKIPDEIQEIFTSFNDSFQNVQISIAESEKLEKTVFNLVQKLGNVTDELMLFLQKRAEDGYQDVFDEDKKLLRRFELECGTPHKIVAYGKDGTTVTRIIDIPINSRVWGILQDFTQGQKLVIRNGKPVSYYEGYERLADGREKASKEFYLQDGVPIRYREGYEKLVDGSRMILKELNFCDGVLVRYRKGYEKFSNGSWGVAKELNFCNGVPYLYGEGYEKLVDGSWKVAKELNFINKIPLRYIEGYEKLADGCKKLEKSLEFSDEGRPYLYEEGYEILSDKNGYVAKVFEFDFKKGKWIKKD